MNLSTQQNTKLYNIAYLNDDNSLSHITTFSINDFARGFHTNLKHARCVDYGFSCEMFKVIYCDVGEVSFEIGIFSYDSIITGEHIKRLASMGYDDLNVDNIFCVLMNKEI